MSQAPWILALETSTQLGGVALLRGEQVRGLILANMLGAHSRRLLRDVRAVLADQQIAVGALAAVVVDRGPGSFTGLRVGMATAKGLCWAAGVPLVGVSSLAALAQAACGWRGLVAPTLDARKGEIYGSLLQMGVQGALEPVLPDCVAAPERWAQQVAEAAAGAPVLWIGGGARAYAPVLLAASGAGSRLGHPAIDAPDPVWVGILGGRRLAERGPDPLETLEPDYLRASDAELSLGARVSPPAAQAPPPGPPGSPATISPSGSA